MKYKNLDIEFFGNKVKQVSESYAKKVFNAYLPVYLLPSKVNPSAVGEWVQPCKILKQDRTFEVITAEYSYYNCNPELGNDICYFININEPKTIYCREWVQKRENEIHRIDKFLYDEHYQLWKAFKNDFYLEEKERRQFRKAAKIGNFKVTFPDGIAHWKALTSYEPVKQD